MEASGPAGTAPATPQALAAIERLQAVPGMSVTHGLALMLGRVDRYLSILHRFLMTQPEQLQRLADGLHGGDLVTARRLAHTLKGAAGTLGADHLARLAGALETRLRELPEGVQALTDWDTAALSQQLGLISAALSPWPDDEQAPVEPGNPEAALAALGHLARLLVSADTAAIALYEQHAAGLRQALGAGADTLGRQILAFEFEAAQQTLQGLRGGSPAR